MRWRHKFKIARKLLPATLFGRALWILVLPIVLVQFVAVYVFYERHWDSVVRNMSSALAGEVAVLVQEYEDPNIKPKRVRALAWAMGFHLRHDSGANRVFVTNEGKSDYPDFFDQLSRKLDYPFMVQRASGNHLLLITVHMKDGVLELTTSKKRLVSSTTYIFIMWMAGSALLLCLIAIVFLRNQMRPIRQLASAAQRFGLGQDVPNFSPRGAQEIRQAGRAFVEMRERIIRQVNSRTEMLAGISHDLRTPITRIKLQLAVMKPEPKAQEAIEKDLNEMEHMIQAYLEFARGEGMEKPQIVEMSDYVAEILTDYQRQHSPVTCHDISPAALIIRPKTLRRAIQNIVDNALRYGKTATLSVRQAEGEWILSVEDEGPGIPVESHESVFRPFVRLESSRNARTGGVGLGLSIAREAAQAHGGYIRLKNKKKGGLKVELCLPLYKPQHI